MDRMIYLRFGNGNLHLPKLIGAFLMVAALLMIVKSGADMFESWDNVKYLNDCLKDQYVPFSQCQEDAFYAGVFVRPDQSVLTAKQAWSAVSEPIGEMFYWFAAFLLGLLLYFTGRMVLPVQESIREKVENVVKKVKRK